MIMTKNCFYGVLLVSAGMVAVIGCAPTETNPQAPAPSANDHDEQAEHDEHGVPSHADHADHDEHSEHDEHNEHADHDEHDDPEHDDHADHDENGEQDEQDEHDEQDEYDEQDVHAGHDQDGHSHEGPHGGELIELGKSHLYHAELVENDSEETMEVYLLDGELEPLPIAATSITFNLIVEGAPKSFPLVAVEAQDGKASHFRAPPSELFEALHVSETTGRLSVTIEGTPYTGKVENDH
jgi:hypothetical protein